MRAASKGKSSWCTGVRLTPLSCLFSGLVQIKCGGWKLSYSSHYARLWMPKRGTIFCGSTAQRHEPPKNALLKKVSSTRNDARIDSIIISDTIGLICNLKLWFCSSDIGTCLVHSQQLTYSLDKQICLHRSNKCGKNFVTAIMWTKLVLCNDALKLICLQIPIYVLYISYEFCNDYAFLLADLWNLPVVINSCGTNKTKWIFLDSQIQGTFSVWTRNRRTWYTTR